MRGTDPGGEPVDLAASLGGLLRDNGRGKAGSGFTPTTLRYFSHEWCWYLEDPAGGTLALDRGGQPIDSCRDSWAEGCP